MTIPLNVPNGSIYLWMYEQGLKGIDLSDIERSCALHGIQIRKKDYDNYYNGLRNRGDHSPGNVFRLPGARTKTFFDLDYDRYPENNFSLPINTDNRWVPCSKDNKPMIKWGSKCMSREEALKQEGQKYLAENLYGTNMIVIDCDGDHGQHLDLETIEFLWQYHNMTNCIMKPKLCIDYYNVPEVFYDVPASFHLTFLTTKVIPTMHFPNAHIDIIGNKRNSLRYYKNKVSNGIRPAYINENIWSEIQSYIRRKEHGSI